MKELTEIANCCGTDKGTVKDEAHGFTEFYDSVFREYRERAIKNGEKLNILEVGVQFGGSLHMFNSYFGDCANVYGIDIDISQNQYINEKNVLCNVDANSKESITKFLDEIGNVKFDIILDDASHISEHQIHTFLYLYKNLNKDGIYIIEDLHTGLYDKQNSPLYYLLFKDKLYFMTDEEHAEFINAIDDVTIYSRNNPKGAFMNQSVTSIIRIK